MLACTVWVLLLLLQLLLLTVRSLLLPISMMVMLGFACWRASSSQEARWLKVSRLHQSRGKA